MFGVYIHIPFCRTKCPYCDFVSLPVGGDPPDAFVKALCREIAAFDGPDRADTLFFGGGTPSLVPPADLGRILDAVFRRFRVAPDAEITLEANPDDVTADRVSAWRGLGINRLSLGVQSFDDRALAWLGRRHDADGARRAIGRTAAVFDNWNMDLIFGGRPHGAWEATLRETAALAPPHVSAYGLTFEEGTPFAARRDQAVDEDTALSLYRQAHRALAAHDRYEISNFCLPGRACRHNLLYWHNEEYAGFGPGAYCFTGGVRAQNPADLEAYLRAPGKKSEALALTPREIKVETLIQHFRLREGITAEGYRERFSASLETDFGAALAGLKGRGLLEWDGCAARPTVPGFELNNEIGLALVGEGTE